MVSNKGFAGQQTGNPHTVGREEEFITKDEMARRLKKTSRTIEIWQRRGYIPFVKIGKAVMYKWSDVVAHLERNYTRLAGSHR
jgi:excisionase family DNA binding protein